MNCNHHTDADKTALAETLWQKALAATDRFFATTTPEPAPTVAAPDAEAQPLPFVTVAQLDAQTCPYALEITDEVHAPTVRKGDRVEVLPIAYARITGKLPGAVPSGALVLAAVNGHAGMFRVNADRDLHAGSLFVERGAWRLLGIVDTPTN